MEPSVEAELRREAVRALAAWKHRYPRVGAKLPSWLNLIRIHACARWRQSLKRGKNRRGRRLRVVQRDSPVDSFFVLAPTAFGSRHHGRLRSRRRRSARPSKMPDSRARRPENTCSNPRPQLPLGGSLVVGPVAEEQAVFVLDAAIDEYGHGVAPKLGSLIGVQHDIVPIVGAEDHLLMFGASVALSC